MKSISTQGLGSSLVLTVVERVRPTPAANDVLVKVHAASVNPKDWKINRSLAMAAAPLPRRFHPALFGDDLAGEVVAIGSAVKSFAVGDRVYGMDMRLRTASLAEYAVIDQGRIAKMPAQMDFAAAAAMPLAAQTALQGLRKAGAKTGAEALIIGASGGVGTYAVQIAKALGCRVTGVCSARNLELVQSLGAAAVIDYNAGDYRKHAGPFDIVFDVTSYETPARCAALLKDKGHFISTGGTATAILTGLMPSTRRASLITVESYTRDLKTLADWVDSGQLRTVIDSRFPLNHAQQAYERSRTGRARGKIIIEIGG